MSDDIKARLEEPIGEDNMKGLRYKEFSIVYMEFFSVEEWNHCDNLMSHLRKEDNGIDQQIFYQNAVEYDLVKRYKMDGFNINIHLDEPYPVDLTGKVFVELSVFFNKTISLSFRLVVDGDYCRLSDTITTDHLIALASLNMGAEYWHSDDDEEQRAANTGEENHTKIDLDIQSVEISDIHIDENFNWSTAPLTLSVDCGVNQFEVICDRYQQFILKEEKKINFQSMNYVFVDIWEKVQHYDDLFLRIREGEIITHIETMHRKELIGLMTLYPMEWPYRDERAFEEACGGNIAIDTDDLVLVNQNMCVVFGTYGLRGGDSPTDWEEHLKERRHYHVSWPEYLLLLEMILAKKYTTSVAKNLLLSSTLKTDNLSHTRKAIEKNAFTGLSITQLLLKLNAVMYSKYMSHKIMYDRSVKRLEVEKEEQELMDLRGMVDQSLTNISDMKELKSSQILNIVLAIISIASLVEITFQPTELPFLENLGIGSHPVANRIIIFVACLMALSLLYLSITLIIDYFKSIFRKKRK